LIGAEVLGSLVALRGGALPTPVQDAWQVLLRNEFHDILPGSSIREVYEVAEAELAGVIKDGTALQAKALAALAAGMAGPTAGVVIVNPDLQPRPIRLTSAQPLPNGQAVAEGFVLSAPEAVAGLSVTARSSFAEAGPLTVSTTGLENGFVKVTLWHPVQRDRQAHGAGMFGGAWQPDLGLCRQTALF
jgi:alpha-mannosidase